MSRYTDAEVEELKRETANDIVKSIERLLGDIIKHLTPCDVCKYNPPSSCDGKPCLLCPACKY